MTKAISANLKAHMAQPATTMAVCFRVTRTDGVEYFYTDHDQDFDYSGDTYTALGGVNVTSLESATGTGVDNLDLQTTIESTGLTDSDIIAGLLDFASFELFALNYNVIGDGIISLKAGTIGEYSSADPEAIFELRGLTQYLQQRVGDLMMRRCGVGLGSAECGVALGPHTVTGAVTGVTNRQTFTVDTVPAARGGLFTFTSGNNNGLSMEVRSISGSTINLSLPIAYDITGGDTYSAYRGCDFLDSTCKDVFDNLVNFRGYPFLTGNDKLLSFPDSPSGTRAG